MSYLPTSLFYYKLCVDIRGKLYSFTHRSQEMSLFTQLSQSLHSSKDLIYVFLTPALALEESKESIYSKSFKNTIIKLHCSGSFTGSPEKRAYSRMTVVENIGLSCQNRTNHSSKSNARRTNSRLYARFSPSLKTPVHIYLSPNNHPSPIRAQNNLKKKANSLKSKPLAKLKLGKSLFCKILSEKNDENFEIYKKCKKIKEENKWLMDEVCYLESLLKFETLEQGESRVSKDSTG